MNRILKKSTIGAAALLGVSNLTVSAAKSTDAKPNNQKMNIVMMFVDDLGWADLGMRNPHYNTPNVDQLFADGMNFERAYVTQPASSPSRASLMTGKQPVRFQLVRHIDNRVAGESDEFSYWPENTPEVDDCMPSRNWLPMNEIIFPQLMKECGYYNMFVGKWHLGGPEFWPDKRGYDEVYGLSDFGNVSNYYAPFFRYRKGADTTKEISNKGDYITDFLTDKAVNMIENYDCNQPFLLSMHYYNVHSPNIGRKDLFAKYKAKGMTDIQANYAAQIEAVDESVGRIRKAIKDRGIEDNTIVIYFSDQGGLYSNYPLRGCKLIEDTMAEGGIRVPLAIYYPGVTERGSVCTTPVQALDFFPTFMEIATGKKYKNKELDGESIMPLLHGKKMKERNLYFFRAYNTDQYAAIINGDWKLIKYHSGKYQLYNLHNDISETTDLKNVYPERFEKMKKDLRNWEENVVPEYENDYRKRINY